MTASSTVRIWSDAQRAVFNFVERATGSAVVEAVAGAGKTTTLVEAVRRMEGYVFVGAYNKKMADELKGRLAGLRGVVAGTFHSAGFGALRKATEGRLEVDDKKVRLIAQRMVLNTKQEGWEPAICALVSMAKQAGFYAADCVARPTRQDWEDLVDRYDVMDRLPEDAGPGDLVGLAERALRESNADRAVVDFDDMVYLPLVRNLRMFRNDWVLIDEAQDTNATRRALAARMLKPGGRLIAVGDPHQAIFGFTGADSDSLELIKRQFSATTLHLSVTYRCPRVVVRAANEYVGHIHAAETSAEGEHGAVEYHEMMTMAQPGDAVLCRYNRHLVDAAFAFIRAGKPARIEGRAIGEGLAALAGKWKVRTLDALVSKLEVYRDREVEKAVAKGDDAKAERIEDQIATMMVLVERGREQGITTVTALQDMIKSMFDDVGASPKLVVLSSVHRSKGLEWGRVFVLGRAELMPSPRAKQPWQKQQELNLCYVAVTRAMRALVDVALPPEAEARNPRRPQPQQEAAA